MRSSERSGWQKMITSSAYRDTLVNRWRAASLHKIPLSVALAKSRLSVSITNTNNIGKRGSPCRNPF